MTEIFAHSEHSDTWLAAWRGEPWDVVNIPLRAGMSIGLFTLEQVEQAWRQVAP